MIIVAGTLSLAPEDIDKIRPAAAAMIDSTRREPGCRHYDFSISITDPSVVHIFEIWDSVEDLKEHFATEHMAEWRAQLGDVVVLDRDLHQYEIGDVSPVG